MRSRGHGEPARGADGAFARAAFWLAAGLVVLLPLVWSPEVLQPFRGPKRELALVLWTALAALFVTGATAAAWRDHWWAPWVGVIAGGLASALASDHPGVVLVRLVPPVLAALGWGALRQIGDAGRRRLLTLVVVAGTLQAALAALMALPLFQPAAFGRIEDLKGRYRWIGTIGNPADVAVLLVLPLLVAATLALDRRRRRWAPLAAAALMLAAILGTRTLSATLAVACGLAVMLWQRAPRRWRLPSFAAGLLALAALAVVGPLAPRVAGSVAEYRHGGWASLGSGRGAGFAAALGMAAAHPVTGVGFGLFENDSFAYLSEDVLARRARVLRLETAFGEAHNDALQHVAETGLLGLLLAAAGIAWAARGGAGAGALPARAPLLAAAAPLLLLQFPTHLAAIAAQWAVLAALALPPLPAAPDARGWKRMARLAIVSTAACVATVIAWERHRTAIALQQASSLVSAIHTGQVTQGRAELARAALEPVEARMRWFPGEWETHVVAGNLAMAAGRREAALAHFDAALRLAERPETRFDVGIALVALGDQEAGYAHLIRAVKLNPRLYRQITDPAIAAALRLRLDADGYGHRQAWMYPGRAGQDGRK
jgi:O-antigen ligase